MREESAQSFPRQSKHELVSAYIESELKKVGIELQQINIDILNNNCTVTTDKKVPEEIMSNISEYTDSKGITIKFLNSG